MIVEVDPDSAVPAYEQLRLQVARLVRSGTLGAGERLPPIRQLAADLELAPGPVQRAWRELEVEGLVHGDGRRGTRVAPSERWRPPSDDEDALRAAARTFTLAARQLGASPEQARAAVDDALASLGDTSSVTEG